MEASVSQKLASLINITTNSFHSDEEDPEDFPFPLTLKKANGSRSGASSPGLNGSK
jgi:hypothetical protein